MNIMHQSDWLPLICRAFHFYSCSNWEALLLWLISSLYEWRTTHSRPRVSRTKSSSPQLGLDSEWMRRKRKSLKRTEWMLISHIYSLRISLTGITLTFELETWLFSGSRDCPRLSAGDEQETGEWEEDDRRLFLFYFAFKNHRMTVTESSLKRVDRV